MNISSAQMVLPAASTEAPAVLGNSRPATVSAAAPAAESPALSAVPAPAPAPTAQFSTDMRVDGQHQVYYEFVDKSTGEVMFEIPPEALREIAESLNLPLAGDASGHSVDVKS